MSLRKRVNQRFVQVATTACRFYYVGKTIIRLSVGRLCSFRLLPFNFVCSYAFPQALIGNTQPYLLLCNTNKKTIINALYRIVSLQHNNRMFSQPLTRIVIPQFQHYRTAALFPIKHDAILLHFPLADFIRYSDDSADMGCLFASKGDVKFPIEVMLGVNPNVKYVDHCLFYNYIKLSSINHWKIRFRFDLLLSSPERLLWSKAPLRYTRDSSFYCGRLRQEPLLKSIAFSICFSFSIDFQRRRQSLLMLSVSSGQGRTDCMSLDCLLGVGLFTELYYPNTFFVLVRGFICINSPTQLLMIPSTLAFIFSFESSSMNLLHISFSFSVISLQILLFQSLMLFFVGSSWLINLFQNCFSVLRKSSCSFLYFNLSCQSSLYDSSNLYLYYCSSSLSALPPQSQATQFLNLNIYALSSLFSLASSSLWLFNTLIC